MSLLVRDAIILTQDAARRKVRGNVFVDDGLINSVGPEAPEADMVVDAAGDILIPGLINTHTHLAMGLLRGYGDDLPLMDWLEQKIWPAEARMDEGIIRTGAQLGLMELVRGGTTTFLDMYFHEQAAAEETAKVGLRGIMGWGLADVGKTPDGLANASMGDVESFLARWRDHPRVSGAPAPHAVYTCNDETFSKSYELAEKFDTIMHTHAHETRREVYDTQEARGKRPLGVLADAGALGGKSLLAHCGWMTKAEATELARAGAAVSHCPVSNMKLATGGVMPLPELMAAGARIGLGTDGAASNNTLDMFETMKFAALVHKHARWDAKVAAASTVLDLATVGGATALGMEKDVGSIEVGKQGDLVLVSVHSPRMTPLHDPVSQLVYAAHGDDVRMTAVGGDVLYDRDAGWSTLEPERVREKAVAAAALVTAS